MFDLNSGHMMVLNTMLPQLIAKLFGKAASVESANCTKSMLSPHFPDNKVHLQVGVNSFLYSGKFYAEFQIARAEIRDKDDEVCWNPVKVIVSHPTRPRQVEFLYIKSPAGYTILSPKERSVRHGNFTDILNLFE